MCICCEDGRGRGRTSVFLDCPSRACHMNQHDLEIWTVPSFHLEKHSKLLVRWSVVYIEVSDARMDQRVLERAKRCCGDLHEMGMPLSERSSCSTLLVDLASFLSVIYSQQLPSKPSLAA